MYILYINPKPTIYIRGLSCSVDFAQCLMPCVHHYSIIQNSPSASKVPHVPAGLTLFTCILTPGNYSSFNGPCSFALSRISHSWNHSAHGSGFKLISFMVTRCIFFFPRGAVL